MKMSSKILATPEGKEWIARHGDVETHSEIVSVGWSEVITAHGGIVILPNAEIEAYKKSGEIVEYVPSTKQWHCDNCRLLSLTEQRQQEIGNEHDHRCMHYGVRVKHLEHHPHIVPTEECDGIRE